MDNFLKKAILPIISESDNFFIWIETLPQVNCWRPEKNILKRKSPGNDDSQWNSIDTFVLNY